MGLDFKAPPRKDSKAWNVLEVLSGYGFRFHSCGCGGPGYRPRTLKDLKKFLQTELLKDPKGREVHHLLQK
ncbi:hypothetical protein [Deinococcus roseus]|nr:hypothetical protein [Deinococcus roseus]